MKTKTFGIDQLTDDNGKAPKYAWPGGYPIYYLCADGGVLCPDCVNKEVALIREAIGNPGTDSQWEVIARDCNYEDGGMICEHCNGKVEAAYV